MSETPAKFPRDRIIRLFRTLDTPEGERDPYLEPELAVFPYTNGGLFRFDFNTEAQRENFSESLSLCVKDKNALLALQNEMASLTFLDPACGSGATRNFAKKMA